MKNNKGVTLIELLIVIVVLGIVAAFGIVNVTSILANTKIKVDTWNIGTLNSVTEDYSINKNIVSGDVFSGFSTDEDRMLTLVSNGYLDNVVVAQQNDAYFSWDIDAQLWTLIGGEIGDISLTGVNYAFSSATLTDVIDDGAVTPDLSKWSTNDDGYIINKTGESRLFIPVSLNTYTITVSAQLSEGTNGGYGIFFDTYLTNGKDNKDNGYILQFDRGFGQLVVRNRLDGGELPPLWRYTPYADNAEWWSATHEIKIVITNVTETTRNAQFFIDGISCGSYSYTNEIADKDFFSGLRGWGSYPTKFFGYSVN